MVMKVKKVKVAFLEDEKARKATFKRRKREVVKKLDELVKCNVKACLILFLKPSKEGPEELCYKFLNLSLSNPTTKMVNQRATTPEKEDGGFQKLFGENLVKKGDGSSCYPLPPVVYQDWFIRRQKGQYPSYFPRRPDGESSSSLPRRPEVYETWYNNKMRNERLYGYYAYGVNAFNVANKLPLNLNLSQNQYQKEPFKSNYQALYKIYDSLPQKLEAFNKKYNLNVNHDLVPDDKYTDTSEEEMDDAEEDGNIASMDCSSTANP